MSCYDEMIPLLLLAMFCALGLTQDVSTCTDGFRTLDQLISTVDSVVGAPAGPLQGIFPFLRVTCDGYLTRLIYSTVPGGAAEQRENEVFNIWRENTSSPGISDLISPSPSRANETLVMEIDANIALYSLDINIPVQADDFIGFTAAQFTSLLFLQFANRSAPRSLYLQSRDRFVSQIELTTTGGDTVFFPLITAVISTLPSSMPPIASSISPTVISPSTTPLSPSLPSQTTMTATPERSNRRVFLFAGVGGGLGGGVLLLCCVAVFIAGWCMHRKKATHQAYDVADRMDQGKSSLSDSLQSNPAYIQHSKVKQNPQVPLSSPHRYVEMEPVSYNRLFSINLAKNNKIRGSSSNNGSRSQHPSSLDANYEDIPLSTMPPGSVSSEIYSPLGTTAPVSDQTSTDQVYYSEPFPRVRESSGAQSSHNDSAGVYYSKATGDQSEETVNTDGKPVYYKYPGH